MQKIMKKFFLFLVLVIMCFMVIYDLFYVKRNHFTWHYEMASAIWSYTIGFVGGMCLSAYTHFRREELTYEKMLSFSLA